MKNSIRVSILVPIYNVEKFIGKCLDSIFSQNYTNVNYVFADDCSTDNSLMVLQSKLAEYSISSERYIIIRHSENMGIAQTRIGLLAEADGDYVQFIDSDDWIENNMIEAMVEATDNGKIDIVGCDFFWEYANGRTKANFDNFAGSCFDNMIKTINFQITPVLWKLLVKKSLYRNFKIDSNINVGEDYIISIKLFFYAKSFKHVEQHLYHYVQLNKSRLSSQIKRGIKDHMKAVIEVESFFKNQNFNNEAIIEQLMLRKFNIRSNFLNNRFLDYDEYNNCFPETKGIWRKINYTKREKFKFWLADHKLFFLLKLIQK